MEKFKRYIDKYTLSNNFPSNDYSITVTNVRTRLVNALDEIDQYVAQVFVFTIICIIYFFCIPKTHICYASLRIPWADVENRKSRTTDERVYDKGYGWQGQANDDKSSKAEGGRGISDNSYMTRKSATINNITITMIVEIIYHLVVRKKQRFYVKGAG